MMFAKRKIKYKKTKKKQANGCLYDGERMTSAKRKKIQKVKKKQANGCLYDGGRRKDHFIFVIYMGWGPQLGVYG